MVSDRGVAVALIAFAVIFLAVGQGVAYLADAGGKMHLLAFMASCAAYVLLFFIVPLVCSICRADS